MAHIIFFEKPGCANNRRQKMRLLSPGHTLEVRNLIGTAWTKELLRPFLEGKPVSECFNPAAPEVRDGRIDPARFSIEEALDAMIANPLLIRRPLMMINGRHLQGFDEAHLSTIISLEPVAGDADAIETFGRVDLDTCITNDHCTIKEE